ncbi:MAG TPA: hypothetical protein PLC51_09900, partial [Candidatus Marinimicrobia bacterium]|nr:hypothetical protein [Candidatus Neomarinimicrobiota bacterium]
KSFFVRLFLLPYYTDIIINSIALIMGSEGNQFVWRLHLLDLTSIPLKGLRRRIRSGDRSIQ